MKKIIYIVMLIISSFLLKINVSASTVEDVNVSTYEESIASAPEDSLSDSDMNTDMLLYDIVICLIIICGKLISDKIMGVIKL